MRNNARVIPQNLAPLNISAQLAFRGPNRSNLLKPVDTIGSNQVEPGRPCSRRCRKQPHLTTASLARCKVGMSLVTPL